PVTSGNGVAEARSVITHAQCLELSGAAERIEVTLEKRKQSPLQIQGALLGLRRRIVKGDGWFPARRRCGEQIDGKAETCEEGFRLALAYLGNHDPRLEPLIDECAANAGMSREQWFADFSADALLKNFSPEPFFDRARAVSAGESQK